MEPLGYVRLRVQIPYVPSYDEDQVALVVLEDSNSSGNVRLCWEHGQLSEQSGL